MHGFKPAAEIILIALIASAIEVDILSGGTLCVLGIGDQFCKWFQNKCLLLLCLCSSSLTIAQGLFVNQ